MSCIGNPQADDLVEAFSLFGDWEQRYQFIIDLGRKLPPLREDEKIEDNRVHGCQATVWMVADIKPGEPPIIEFRAESDAAIVNGLIAILQRLYNGQTINDILEFPIEDFMHKIELDEHLSPTRRNGLFEMVKRIRRHAILHMN